MREVSTELGGRGYHLAGCCRQLRQPLALPRHHEEQPVLRVEYFRDRQRTTNFGAELIALQDVPPNALFVIEELVRIEVVIANVFEDGTVVLVGSRLGYDADDAATVAPILRVVIA